MDEAARATEEHALGAKEVLRMAGSMATLTRQIAASVRENAVGAKEITHGRAEDESAHPPDVGGGGEQKRGGEMVVKAVESVAARVAPEPGGGGADERGAARPLAGESELLKQRVETCSSA